MNHYEAISQPGAPDEYMQQPTFLSHVARRTKRAFYGCGLNSCLLGAGMVSLLAGTNSLNSQPAVVSPRPLVSWVDPFLGVDHDGNTTPAAGVPFGFVWLCADTEDPPTSGYNSNAKIVGFSHTRVSGTGGASKYGNFMVIPELGAPRQTRLASPKSAERASPGYYTVTLADSGIQAELTATRLVGLHRYRFPASPRVSILIDASSVIETSVEQLIQKQQQPVECAVRITGPGRVEGSGRFIGGWNPAPYALYFAAEFDRQQITSGTWTNGQFMPGAKRAAGQHAGVFFTFDGYDNRPVELKCGLSFISSERARANIRGEMPSWDFEAVRRAAGQEWETALQKIQVRGGSPTDLEVFYSGFFRCHYMPHDLTGENAWWRSSEPHYEDYYCLWDTFRTLNPLMTLVEPERERDLVRSLIDTFVHTGWMPDARIAGANGMTQGGSSGDILVADAAVKGMQGIDYKTAYAALVRNADTDSPRPLHEGRELADYLRLGYMSMPETKVKDLPGTADPAGLTEYDRMGYTLLKNTRSASRTMEYAYNDFCVAEVAGILGRGTDNAKYLNRSCNWTNLWDPQTRSIRPRHADGRWLTPFSPTHNYPDSDYDYWDSPLYEGNGWQYTTYVPHDPQALINRMGGPTAFVTWLDEFFQKEVYDPGNEPDFLAPYLYIHAGRPDRTEEQVRRLLATQFKLGRAGLPGNDDAGAMSAWQIWGAIGLYPNAGQPFYYIGSPIFKQIRMDLGHGKSFTIETRDNSSTNLYVRSATLNGKPLQRAWLTHSEIAAGGVLLLDMSATPSDWGTRELPPSLSLLHGAGKKTGPVTVSRAYGAGAFR
jgi:predicted alpha-1,2-mannosidase